MEPSEPNKEKPVFSSAKPTAPVEEDPFKVFESASASTYSSSGLFNDPLENIDRSTSTGNTNKRDRSPKQYAQDMNPGLHSLGRQPSDQAPANAFDNILPTMQLNKTSGSQKAVSRNRFHSYDTDDNNSMADQYPKYHEHMETADDIWLTVAEIPLFTQPTNASPPPLATKKYPANKKDNKISVQSTQGHSYSGDSARKSDASPIDELEDFAMGKPQISTQDRAEFSTSEEEIETSFTAEASAASIKEEIDRAEAKFKHAKEVREREWDAHERDLYGQDAGNKEEQEMLDRGREEEEKEKEQEQRHLERLREQERERERERKAVERATREARERAAAEARLRAEREKVEAERRERERVAVQRAAAEARQRAAADARQRVERESAEKERAERERSERERVEREKAERAAAEARQRASAERMAVERAAAEARKRAAEDARRRAAAAAAATEEKQRKSPEDDLESFFGMGARATSAPAQRPTSSDTFFNSQSQTKGAHNTSPVFSSTMKKASSTTNIVDDLSAIFGGPPSSGEFQDIEGESEERRRARLERHQRTAERAQKALAEKNERDRQAQMEQAERHRIGEMLEFEIKRWAAGKEGNLRALLSTLQYVLWPECGWQPVSLTDLITAAAVKKVYRKATLCIHPDKVQQKGSTIQQKYIAEKVFDLLKEAWNKFNSEELF